MQSQNIASVSSSLAVRMEKNNAATVATNTPILLNSGAKDIVVLPSQETKAVATICRLNPNATVHLHSYPTATHYNTMALSFADTLAWMDQIRSGKSTPTDCHPSV
jgi:hypothetical protein